jgi:hypothetical protein
MFRASSMRRSSIMRQPRNRAVRNAVAASNGGNPIQHGRFSHKEMSMPKSLLSDKKARRLKEPFNPALEDPIALTPDQLETIVGGLDNRQQLPVSGTGGATTGARPPVKLL